MDGGRFRSFDTCRVGGNMIHRMTTQRTRRIALMAVGWMTVLLPCGCGTLFPVLAPEGALVRISIEGRFVNMINHDLYHEWVDSGFGNPSALRKVTRQYYEFFRDDAEILIVTSPSPALGGVTLRVFNDVEGVGIGPIDRRCEFGAESTLSQIITLYGRNELTIRTVIHEIAHRWANGLEGDIALASGHWGFSDVHGQLGGWRSGTLETLGGGLFRGVVAPNGFSLTSLQYAPLELYLMGLLPAGQVPDVTVAVDPVIASIDFDTTTFRATELRTIGIGDIIQVNGERNPPFGRAPTDFSIAVIVLTPGFLSLEDQFFYEKAIDFLTRKEDLMLLDVFDSVTDLTPLKAEQDAFTAFGLEQFQNFHRATGGRGTLTLRTATELRRDFGE